MNSSEIRRAFLDFFAKRDHQVVGSAPIVPQNDPTLMFVNAGMVPFKDVFTGRERREYVRACSSQKCIRISGKHNDLENVGVTARHHTFFEMLGNFSFGDYFKEQAIVHAWDLLTKEFDIPADRLVVTVFKGEEGFAADDEAAALWRKVSGLPEERILRLGMVDNFWSMGPTGPCGPCSEIHFFHGADPGDPSSFGEEPGMDGRGWTEIWNLVFMQYDRAAEGAEATPLPAPSIDTGAGLERLAGVLQGVTSNYDTDVFRALIDDVAAVAGRPYGASESNDDVSMRVIADHARTTAFLMAEGVMPDKQKREYVLRRVMRRAIRHGHRLGIERLFLHQIAGRVVDVMGDDYPELVRRRELIEQVTEGEEARFRATLKRGMKILDERFAAESEQGAAELPAAVAADLYTTYGFPLDLTEVICAEQKYTVDRAGAEAIIGSADKTAGPIDPGAAIDPAYREVANSAVTTSFTGYETESDRSEIVALIKIDGDARSIVEMASAGDEVEIACTRTPFYAESGGQVGDRGEVRSDRASATVSSAYRRIGDVTLHHARVTRGEFKVSDAVDLVVDHEARSATRRNHSATHLLHWALKEVLGQHAQQKGSLVGPDVMRFDFAHNSPLTPEEIERVEDLVNAKILTNAPVQTDVLSIDEARAKGAVAIFEEKYGDVVRVLTMTEDSVELCGGTHARALGDIGLFKIASEGGTAAGVRRVNCATGHRALAYVRELQHEIGRARAVAKAHGVDLADKIAKLLKHDKMLEKRVAELEKELLEGGGAGGGVDAMLGDAKTIGDVNVLAVRVADGTPMNALRELAEKLRDKLAAVGSGKAAVLAACANGPKAQLALLVTKNANDKLKAGTLIKVVAKHVGGSGGGRPDMAQAGGGNPAGLDDAVAALYPEVASTLNG